MEFFPLKDENKINKSSKKQKEMKKNILKATVVAAFALVAGFNVYNSQKSDVMSELALANVEALAESELSQKCGVCSTDKQVYCCTLVIEGLGTFTLNKD